MRDHTILLDVFAAINSKTDLPDVLQKGCQAVDLLQARSGGITAYDPDRECLEIIADYGAPISLVGTTIKAGEGMADLLIFDRFSKENVPIPA